MIRLLPSSKEERRTLAILTVVGILSLSLVGCKKGLPAYPEQLKEFHLVEVRGKPLSPQFASLVLNVQDIPEVRAGEQVNCLRFEVVHVNPYQFNFTGVVPLVDCHEVSGYKPQESVLLWNWVDDVFRIAEENNCFR